MLNAPQRSDASVSAMRVDALLRAAAGRVSRSDARIVLSHFTGLSREALIMHPETLVEPDNVRAYLAAVEKIEKGCPVAYITGVREFWCRPFRVTPDVLVPRPDTETLIEAALEIIHEKDCTCVLDMGTGSGIIAVTLALEAPRAHVTATDVSSRALAVAEGNAKRLGARVNFIESDWFQNLSGQTFDLIVSNPPYIHPEDEHLKALVFEPAGALTDGIDGLSDIRTITEGAKSHLTVGGSLLFEHGYDQGKAVRELLTSHGFSDVHTVRDLGGNERVTTGLYASDHSSSGFVPS